MPVYDGDRHPAHPDPRDFVANYDPRSPGPDADLYADWAKEELEDRAAERDEFFPPRDEPPDAGIEERTLDVIPACCDYRDHSPGPCACPHHERSEVHPFGEDPF